MSDKVTTGIVPKNVHEISHTARMKSYPDGSFELLASDVPCFRQSGWEEHGKEATRRRSAADKTQREATEGTSAADQERSMRRAAGRVRDLALCNDFRWFVTLTLDPAKIDRHDMEALTHVLNRWSDNRVRRKGLRYILVPERHKDGAIASAWASSMTRCRWWIRVRSAFRAVSRASPGAGSSGKSGFQPGKIVYNIPDWSLGFSTALQLTGDYHAAVAYVCKYVRKQQEKIGGRWYYSGGKLEEPEVSYLDIGYREVEAMEGSYTFSVPGRGVPQCTGDFVKERNVRSAKSTVEAARSAAALIRQAKKELETASEYQNLLEEMSAPADQILVMESIAKRMVSAFDALDDAETKLTI